MNKAYLLTGGNLGEREKQLSDASDQIDQYCGKILRVSSLYETAAWGREDQPSFLNQALVIETRLPPGELLEKLLFVEKKHGRLREIKYGPRTIDIDILLYDDIIMDTPGLVLPHPQLPKRRFALTPLAEIAPALVHPVLKKSIRELLETCPDQLEVKKYLPAG